jgi:hypothetical protein
VDKLGLLCCEARPSLLGPCFNPRYVFGLDFSQVLFGGPTDPPTKVVVDEGRYAAVEIDGLVDQVAVEERKEDGRQGGALC